MSVVELARQRRTHLRSVQRASATLTQQQQQQQQQQQPRRKTKKKKKKQPSKASLQKFARTARKGKLVRGKTMLQPTSM
jgi:hypothetical protein